MMNTCTLRLTLIFVESYSYKIDYSRFHAIARIAPI